MTTYNQSEAAEKLGIGRSTLIRWHKKGYFEVGKRHPRRRLIVYTDADLAVIRKWMNEFKPIESDE